MRRLNVNNWKTWLGILICAASLPAMADPAANQDQLAAANTAFGFDLFGQITREHPDTNVFISPFSVSTVLQMVDNGAAGATREEMDRILHTDGLSPAALNAACKRLNESLNSQTNVILEQANAIWYRLGIPLKPAFISVNKKFFQAELAGVDFLQPQSAQTINDWAEKNTHGKIQQVVSFPFPRSTALVLANAIYFKGKWEIPFDRRNTKPHIFHLAVGGETRAPMMWQHGRFSYERGDGFQAVRMPYAGRRLWMDVFLPDASSSLKPLQARFAVDSERHKMLTWFLEREGTLALPRFKLEYGIKLNDALQALGMSRVFHDADFSAMSDKPLILSEVRQKSYIAVDEQGTEAAAVTTGIMQATAVMRPVMPFEMIVDRPFFFVIEDNQTQSILFMGAIYDPTK